MTIRAVFFDMGGTIERIRYTPAYRLQATPGIKQLLLSAGIDLGLNDQQLYDVVSSGHGSYRRWTLETMEELPTGRAWSEFILAGYPIDMQKLAGVAEDLMFYFESRFYQRELRPEVPSDLKILKDQGYKIGLISNVCSLNLVPAKLDEYGIRNYFHPIVLSSEYGRRKPDPAIFHYAARLANVPTSECLYVGDRIARDIEGSRRAGFKLAVQIINNFDHGEEDEGAKPDAVITNMNELLEILKAEALESRPRGRPAVPPDDMIRAFLFDAGDVLYYRPQGQRNFQAFLSELGVADKEIPEAAKKIYRDQAFIGSISQSQYRQATLGLYGITEPRLVERGSQAIDEDENGVQFIKGVPETLKSLKEMGYMLGIVTDTANPIHVKLRWFERGGFGNVWDSIISSHEIGVEKPDPRIYAAALQQLGLSASQAVFVGHSAEELDGARLCGMKTIAFNYEKSTQADYYIDSFEDLLKVELITAQDQTESGIRK